MEEIELTSLPSIFDAKIISFDRRLVYKFTECALTGFETYKDTSLLDEHMYSICDLERCIEENKKRPFSIVSDVVYYALKDLQDIKQECQSQGASYFRIVNP